MWLAGPLIFSLGTNIMTNPLRQSAVALLFALACQSPGHTQGYGEGPLLVTDAGPHFSNDLLSEGSFEWFGVFQQDGKTQLRKTRVLVKPYKSKGDDYDDWDFFVHMEGQKPILLIDRFDMRGSSPSMGSPIEFGREPGATYEVTIAKRHYTLRFPNEEYSDQLEIISGKKIQRIQCPGWCPVIWVGDLDGDSKLDLITAPSGGGGGGKWLFLSLPAQKDELVFPAGSYWDQNG